MNIIDRAALGIAQSIRRNYPEAPSEVALKYSLSLLINTLSAITVSMGVCIATGHWKQGAIVVFFFLFMRYFSGGVHLRSSLTCSLTSAGIVIVLAHLQFNYWYLGFLCSLAAFMIYAIKAPDGIEKVSRVDPRYYPLLKAICLAVVALNMLVFQSSLLSAVFLTQALTLTNQAYTFIHYLERRKTNES